MLSGRRIICLSSLSWGGRPTSRHHIARELLRSNDVLFVDPPANVVRTRTAHRGRLFSDGGDAVLRFEPPPHLPFGGAVRFHISTPLNQRRYAAAVERAAVELGWRDPILWYACPVYSGALLPSRVRRTLPGAVHVLHVTDAIWHQPQYRPAYDRFFRALVEAAAVVVASTEEIAEGMRRYGADDVHVLPHGVDTDRFAAALRRTAPPPGHLSAALRPRIGFVGQLDHRLDLQTVRALAAGPGSVTLVGSSLLGAAGDHDLARAGCHLVGEVAYDELPAWLGSFDVAVLPYRDDPLVRASRPLKLLEYLAAGLPVVSVDIPAARALAPSVVLAPPGPDFAAAVARVWSDGAGAGDDARAARAAVAAGQSWAHRAAQLSDLIAAAGG